jgi:hypothetical protein
MELAEAAEKALKRPDYFMYFGDLDEKVWGRMFNVTRDSNLLNRANWISINEIMKEFEDDWTTEVSSHWAVGWVEQGRVRVYDENGQFTKAFERAVDIANDLADYPILDEALYSEMEWNELYEYIAGEVKYYTGRFIDGDDLPSDFPDRVFALVSEDHWCMDGVSDAAMREGVEEAYIIWKMEEYQELANQERIC